MTQYVSSRSALFRSFFRFFYFCLVLYLFESLFFVSFSFLFYLIFKVIIYFFQTNKRALTCIAPKLSQNRSSGSSVEVPVHAHTVSSLSPPKISSSSASPAPSPKKRMMDASGGGGGGGGGGGASKFNYALAKQNPFFRYLRSFFFFKFHKG